MGHRAASLPNGCNVSDLNASVINWKKRYISRNYEPDSKLKEDVLQQLYKCNSWSYKYCQE